MSAYRIIKGPHVLFVGANGTVTAGITVERIAPMSVGYRNPFDINGYSLKADRAQLCTMLGLNQRDYDAIVADVSQLEDQTFALR